MPKLLILSLALGLMLAGCASADRSQAPPPGVQALPTVEEQAATPPPAPTPTPLPQPTPTTAKPVSNVAPAVQPPEAPPAAPTPVRGGTTLPVPSSTSVVWGGCASDGFCRPFNFYWGPTHEAVLQNGEPQIKVQHELCHAHQHLTINGGTPLSPSDYDLESWYSTAEGRSFGAAVAGLAWPWTHSAVNNLEDFAWTCAYWYLDPAHLLQVSPPRYDWAAANLP
jgi:hypothetical protein